MSPVHFLGPVGVTVPPTSLPFSDNNGEREVKSTLLSIRASPDDTYHAQIEDKDYITDLLPVGTDIPDGTNHISA